MAESLSDRDAAARDAEKELAKAKTDLDKSLRRLQDLKDQNKTLGAAQNDLKQQITSLDATIASLKAAAAPAEDKPATNDTNTNDQNDAGLSPRDRTDVEKAVGDLPGFDNLGADKQQTLIGMLEKGECVTDSLKAAYGHVSPIALRSLFRDLGGRC
jgi:septal ring factor EnvC (AmiA/AmiB activator)